MRYQPLSNLIKIALLKLDLKESNYKEPLKWLKGRGGIFFMWGLDL